MTTDGQPAGGGGQLAPLSDARLAELATFIGLVTRMIEEEWTVTGTFGDDGIGQALRDAADISRVLAERERLLAENAELRSIASCLPVMYGAFQERHGERA